MEESINASNRIPLKFCSDCVGFEFVKAPLPTYGYLLTTYCWWLLNIYLFYFVLFLPRVEQEAFLHLPVNVILLILVTFVSFMCLVSLVRSTFTPPGVLEDGYEEILTNETDRTICSKCKKVRPKRTHHCRVCRACIRQFDHHCWWINNCVGEDNKWIFTLLIFYSTALSFLMVLTCAVYFYFDWYTIYPLAQSAVDTSLLSRNEYRIVIVHFILTGIFSRVIFSQFLTRILFVRTDTTSFQATVDPMYKQMLPPLQDINFALYKLFGTHNKLVWLFGPLRCYKPPKQIIYNYSATFKQPNIL